MKENPEYIGSRIMRMLAPLWLFAALVITYVLGLSASNSTAAVLFTLLPTFLCIAFCIYKKAKNSLESRHIIVLIMLLGIAVRVCYILATDWNERQHDVFVFETQGHAGYIYTIMKTGKLPETNTGLFYHPPLHPYIMGTVGRLLSKVINTTDQVFEALQLLPAYYSLMCGVVFFKILNLFKLRQSTKILFFAFFLLHPSLIIFSGSINNDILCLLLSVCAVLYLLRFYKEQSIGNAVFMGIFLGLAMMTKLSAVTIAPVIAVVFIYRLAKPKNSRSKVLISELCFGLVSIPLGMWHPVRNLIKYDQPLGYVMPIGKTHPLYCGDKSFFDRFISVPVRKLFDTPYCMPEDDYNIPVYTVKCSVFGEYSFDFPKWAAVTLLILNCLIIIFCIFATIYAVVKKDSKGIILASISAVSVLFFIWFNIRYPNGCSMDFRYISLCLACSAVNAAAVFDQVKDSKIRIAAAIPIVLFTALSTGLYLSCRLL